MWIHELFFMTIPLSGVSAQKKVTLNKTRLSPPYMCTDYSLKKIQFQQRTMSRNTKRKKNVAAVIYVALADQLNAQYAHNSLKIGQLRERW